MSTSATDASAPSGGEAAPLTHDDLLEFLECARYGELEDVLELLKLGADANFKDAGGSTALHKAAANGHVEVMRALHAAGAVFCANGSGNTPLHWACLNGHEAAARFLLESYAGDVDVFAKNSFGRSALTEALTAGREELGRLLLAHSSADPSAAATKGAADGGEAGAEGGFVEESDSEVEEDALAEGEEDSSAAVAAASFANTDGARESKSTEE